MNPTSAWLLNINQQLNNPGLQPVFERETGKTHSINAAEENQKRKSSIRKPKAS